MLKLFEAVLQGARVESRTRRASPAAAARAIPTAASRSVRVLVKECDQRGAVLIGLCYSDINHLTWIALKRCSPFRMKLALRWS